MKWWILAAVGIIFVSWFPLVGLPGVIPLYLGAPLYELINGTRSFELDMAQLGDTAWPLAILLATLGPCFLPLSWILARRIFKRSSHQSLGPSGWILLLVVYAACQALLGCMGLIIVQN